MFRIRKFRFGGYSIFSKLFSDLDLIREVSVFRYLVEGGFSGVFVSRVLFIWVVR